MAMLVGPHAPLVVERGDTNMATAPTPPTHLSLPLEVHEVLLTWPQWPC